jgi:hypothetical protein
MNLSSEHLKAIIKIKHLKKELLEEGIVEEDCLRFESLNNEQKSMIASQAIYVMNNGFAHGFSSIYSNPVEQYIDPIHVYGERGIYLVVERDSETFTFFTSKKEAVKFADDTYDKWIKYYGGED